MEIVTRYRRLMTVDDDVMYHKRYITLDKNDTVRRLK